MIIVTRSVFQEGNKYYPQVYLQKWGINYKNIAV